MNRKYISLLNKENYIIILIIDRKCGECKEFGFTYEQHKKDEAFEMMDLWGIKPNMP